MVEGALTSREHQRGDGTLPVTKPKKVAESREKPKCRRPMVTIIWRHCKHESDVRFTPKADMPMPLTDVRFVPKADIQVFGSQQNCPNLSKGRRDSERCDGLDLDHEIQAIKS